jgi:uncharacterized membrane protein YkvA (DUF1232 family)
MRIVTRVVEWFSFPYCLFLVIQNPDISWKIKLKAGLILAAMFFYFLDPVDIIPDFTPLLGWMDDLVIVPIAMAITGKVVPEINIAELRQKARSDSKRILFWALMIITAMIMISLSTLGLLIYLAVKYWT